MRAPRPPLVYGPNASLQRRPFVAAAIVFVVALVLRLRGLGRDALWRDEAVSYWIGRLESWRHLWSGQFDADVHPPLHHSLIKLFLAFGHSEAVARLPSAIASSAATIPLLFAAREFVGPRAALVAGCTAALLCATSYEQVRYGQEARPYALMTLAAALALYGFVRLIVRPEERDAPLWRIGAARAAVPWACVSIGQALMLWLHGTGALFVLSIWCVAIAAWGLPRVFAKRSAESVRWRNLTIATAAALVVWSPHLAAFEQHVARIGRDFWARPASTAELTGALTALLTLSEPTIAVTIAFTLLFAVGIGCAFARHSRSATRALVASIVVPPVSLWIASVAFKPMFLSRVFLHAELATFVFYASIVAWMWNRNAIVGWSLGACLVLTNVVLDVAGSQDAQDKGPWREVGELLRARVESNDAVILSPPFLVMPIACYFDPELERAPVFPAQDSFTDGSRAIQRELFETMNGRASRDLALSTAQNVWLVYYARDLASIAPIRDRVDSRLGLADEVAYQRGQLRVEHYR